MESQKVSGAERSGNGGRYGAVKEELDDVSKRLKVGACRLVGISSSFVKGKVSEEIGIISKRASCSAFLDSSEGFEERFRFDSKGGVSLMLRLRACLVSSGASVWCMRWICTWVKGVDDVLDGRRIKGSKRLVLAEGFEGALVFVKISEALCFI